MRRRIWIFCLLVAAAGGAAVGVRASFAARAAIAASTSDATYSCRVNSQHFVKLYASVTLPPVKNRAQPGVLVLTTGTKVVKQGNTTLTKPQVYVGAMKNGLKIDKSSCTKMKKQIPLKPKGLPTPGFAITSSLRGYDSEQCGTAGKVLVRLRLRTVRGVPSHALMAIRNENARKRAVAFYNWSPSKITVFTSTSCAVQ